VWLSSTPACLLHSRACGGTHRQPRTTHCRNRPSGWPACQADTGDLSGGHHLRADVIREHGCHLRVQTAGPHSGSDQGKAHVVRRHDGWYNPAPALRLREQAAHEPEKQPTQRVKREWPVGAAEYAAMRRTWHFAAVIDKHSSSGGNDCAGVLACRTCSCQSSDVIAVQRAVSRCWEEAIWSERKNANIRIGADHFKP
jgi:hypothetical protein